MSGEAFVKKENRPARAGSGVHHWLLQRYTAVLMIPFSFLFVNFIFAVILGNEAIINFLVSPFAMLGVFIFFGASLWHASLGMEIIIEDYVVNKALKLFLLYFIKSFNIITAFVLLCSWMLYILY